MFPELKKSKNAIKDLRSEVAGAAKQQADPFSKFNVSLDNIQEKVGGMILPALSDFLDFITKPGGIADQVGKFIDDLGNPKTDVGKFWSENVIPVFQSLGGFIQSAVKFLGEFFKSGAGSFVLGVLKSVLWTIKQIINFATFATDTLSEMLGLKKSATAASVNKVSAGVLSFTGGKELKNAGKFKATGDVFSFGSISSANTVMPNAGYAPITVNVNSADPKAVVQAIRDYSKQNGGSNSFIKPKGKNG